MKAKFLFFLLGLTLCSEAFSQIRDSIQVGLPTSLGVKTFTLVQTRWSNSPAVFESIIITAVPQKKLSAFRDRVNSTSFRDFSTTAKTAFALLYTDADTNFAALNNPVVFGDSLKNALTKLAGKSSRPELINAPIIASGFAKASRFALITGSALPSRTIAMASLRAYRLDAFAGSPVSGVPHLVLTGEVSGPDARNNAALYFSEQLKPQVLSRRAGSELIRQAIEMNASQSTFSDKSAAYCLDFFQRAIQKRVPAGSNPVAGPVTLQTIAANSGHLGSSTVWNSFKPENYALSAFAGPLSPASSQWFFDAADALVWKDFHISAFDSVIVDPLPLPVVPYCSGQRPSALSARFAMRSGITLNAGNYFRFEVSDITGNFDNPVYQARWFGSTLSALPYDSIVDGLLSDNLSYMMNVPDPNVKRYRLRVVSSNPYYESPNFGETDISFCGPLGGKPRVYLSTLKPYKSFYNPGDSVSMWVYANPDFPYTPGNNLRIELSDKASQFTAGLSTVVFSGVPPFTGAAVLDSFMVKIKLPDTLSFGSRYRLKPYIEGVSAAIGRQTSGNGHDITVVPNQSGTEIQLSTSPVTNIQQTSAVSGGVILFNGGSAILERGVCWSTSPVPTTAGSKTSDGTGIGAYISNVTGLLAGTTYYLRAYARNANETKYGQEISFSTLLGNQVPVLTTDSITAITQTQAISGGNITFDGNSDVTVRGVCWNTGGSPTINLITKTEDGTGTGTFISNVTGLEPNTQYCVRAYAVNSTGVGYGNEVCFTTAATVVVLPTISTFNPIQLSTCDSARSGGLINFDGGSAITARGVVWSTQANPTVDLPTKTVNGTGTGSFTSKFGDLSSGTTYFIRAYATNSAGTGYGEDVSLITCVSNKKLKNSVQVFLFPNPAQDVVRIVSEEPLSNQFRVMNYQGSSFPVSGKLIDNGIELDIRSLPAGSYFIQISTPNGNVVFPLVKS